MATKEKWREFALEAANKFEALSRERIPVGIVVDFVDNADAVTNEELRDFLIASIDEMDGFPESFAQLMRLLKQGASQEELLQHMNSPIN